VEIKNFFLYIGFCLLLNGCFQSSAMLGPTITVATTGNVYQAGFSYSANKVFEKETGMTTVEHLTQIIDNEKKEEKIDDNLIKLVNNNLAKTRIEKDFVLLLKRNIENTRKKINLIK